MYIKQRYKYDCWVSAVFNFIKYNNLKIELEYFNLLKNLKTTWFWWTKPEKIIEFLENNNIKSKSNFDLTKSMIILVDQVKFYNDWESLDYWHYVYYTGNYKNNLMEIFDPWDWKIIYKNKEDLSKSTLDVLVWKKRRYSSFFISLI